MIQIICCSSLLSVPGSAGAFSRDFTTSLAPECRAFSGALKIEKLKAPLIPGPEGAVDTNDWCITLTLTQRETNNLSSLNLQTKATCPIILTSVCLFFSTSLLNMGKTGTYIETI